MFPPASVDAVHRMGWLSARHLLAVLLWGEAGVELEVAAEEAVVVEILLTICARYLVEILS